jgi:glycine cleavage system H protein
VNELLVTATETVNTDPYGEGWICEITTSDSSDFDELLDPASYGALTNN